MTKQNETAMNFRNISLFLILLFTIFLVGCPTSEKPASDSQTSKAKPEPSKATNLPPAPEVAPNRTEAIKAENLTPLVESYCVAMTKGDDAALAKIYSRASWKALSADARSEGKRSVAKYLGESEPTGNTCKVINEKIGSTSAEATVITESYPKGVSLKFVKENGAWKMTNQSADFDAVRKTARKAAS